MLPILNAQQQAAVQAPVNGSLLLNAGAGTGKTTTLVARAQYIVNQGEPQESIVLFVFSQKASKDAKERLRAAGLRGVEAMTMHALGRRLIYSNRAKLGFTAAPSVITDDNKLNQILMEVSERLALCTTPLRQACEWLSIPFQGATWQNVADEIRRQDPRLHRKVWEEIFGRLPVTTQSDANANTAPAPAAKFTPAGEERTWPIRSSQYSTQTQERVSHTDDMPPAKRLCAAACDDQLLSQVTPVNAKVPMDRCDVDEVSSPVTTTSAGKMKERKFSPFSSSAAADDYYVHRVPNLEDSPPTFPPPPPETTPLNELQHSSWLKIIVKLYYELAKRYASAAHGDAFAAKAHVTALNRSLSIAAAEATEAYAHFIKKAKDRGLGPQHFRGRDEGLYRLFQAELCKRNVIDFGDMILLAERLLRESCPEDLNHNFRKYRYILVDEAQDLNPAQTSIIWRLFERSGRLTIVGDDKQSIYGFHGSAPNNLHMLDQALRASEGQWQHVHKELTLNNRSTPNILQVANELLKTTADDSIRELVPANPTSPQSIQPPVRIIEAGTLEHEAQWIRRMIQQRAAEGVPFNQQAVLVRAYKWGHNMGPYSCVRSLREEFDRCNLPYKMANERALLQRKPVKDVLSYVALALDPHDDEAFMAVLNDPKRGLGSAARRQLEAVQVSHYERWSLYTCAREMVRAGAAERRHLRGLRSYVRIIDDLRRASLVCRPAELIYGALERIDYVHWLEVVAPAARAAKKRSEPTAAAGPSSEDDEVQYDFSSSSDDGVDDVSAGGDVDCYSEEEQEEEDWYDAANEAEGSDADKFRIRDRVMEEWTDEEWLPSNCLATRNRKKRHSRDGGASVGGGVRRGTESANRALMGPEGQTPQHLARQQDLHDDVDEGDEYGDEDDDGLAPEDPLRSYAFDFSGFGIRCGPLRRLLREAALFSERYSGGENVKEVAWADGNGTGPPSLMRLAWHAACKDADVAQIILEGGEYQDWAATLKIGPMVTREFVEYLRSTVGDGKHGPLDQNNVVISTVHAAKGLEWDCVYCARWEQDLMPMKYRKDSLLAQINADAPPLVPHFNVVRGAITAEQHRAEEERLAHVAATRARRELYITYARYTFNTNTTHEGEETESLQVRNPSPLVLRLIERFGTGEGQARPVVKAERLEAEHREHSALINRRRPLNYGNDELRPHPRWV